MSAVPEWFHRASRDSSVTNTRAQLIGQLIITKGSDLRPARIHQRKHCQLLGTRERRRASGEMSICRRGSQFPGCLRKGELEVASAGDSFTTHFQPIRAGSCSVGNEPPETYVIQECCGCIRMSTPSTLQGCQKVVSTRPDFDGSSTFFKSRLVI
jgi:hypothetical protein